jgi:hypothetical protein
MARRGMEISLGPVFGMTVSLGRPKSGPVAVAAPAATSASAAQGGAATTAQTGQTGTASASGVVANRPITGTVQTVDGTTITLAGQSGAVTKAIVSSSTSFMKNTTITAADIKVGDTVTVVGQAAPDGSIAALQVTDGIVTQTGGSGGFARQSGAASSSQGSTGTGSTGTGGTGTRGAGANAGQSANASTVTGTVQKIDATSMTIVEQGGQSTIVTIGTTTRLHKTSTAALADVTSGEQVTIIGQAGTDGSITATVVQIGSPS